MKYLNITILLLALCLQVHSQNNLILECKLNKPGALENCLQQLTPETQQLLIKGTYYQKTDALSKYLPQNPQLELIYISFDFPTQYSAFADCFRNSSNLHTLKLDLGGYFSVNKQMKYFKTMFIGLQSLKNLSIEWGEGEMTDMSGMVEMFEPINNQLEIFEYLSRGEVSDYTPMKTILNNQANMEQIQFNINFINTKETSFQTLQKLCFQNSKLKKANLVIKNLPKIFSFYSFENLFNESLQELVLDLQSGEITYLDGFETFTQNLQNLKTLNLVLQNNMLNSNQITYLQEGFQNITYLENLNLDLSINKIDNLGLFQYLFSDLSNLEVLEINISEQQSKLKSLQGIQNAFTNQTQLRLLNLSSVRNSLSNIDDAIESVKTLSSLRNLSLNFLSNCMDGQNDEQYSKFIQQNLPQLQDLYVQTSSSLEYYQSYCLNQNTEIQINI